MPTKDKSLGWFTVKLVIFDAVLALVVFLSARDYMKVVDCRVVSNSCGSSGKFQFGAMVAGSILFIYLTYLIILFLIKSIRGTLNK